jgi:DNA-binding response OmpR family regulator
MTQAKILLVEDDPILGFMLRNFLEKNNFEVMHCTDGESAWGKFMKYKYDICLLDIMLPGKLDGVELAKRIRQKSNDVPLMLLTSKKAEEIVDTFQFGVDGYLIKPYNLHELICRMNVFLRRSKGFSETQLSHFELGDMIFDFDLRHLKNNRVEFELTQREAELLRYFCMNPGRLIRKEQILSDLWGKNDQYLERSLGVFIGKIRKYLKSQSNVSIQTIPRVGFKFNVAPTEIISEISLPQMHS